MQGRLEGDRGNWGTSGDGREGEVLGYIKGGRKGYDKGERAQRGSEGACEDTMRR